MVKPIAMTPAIRAALDAVARAETAFRPGEDSFSAVDVHKLALADAVLSAVALARPLDALPRRADRGVVYVQLKPRRRRA